ncbi:sigma 54-interacting transcriptional regulator [Myxococcota bacterium]|nr:sigma 54-interacting transcriptional regulator [Myxococcota bacterium]MBU1533709.1 sigma 54-interacting transcriptional regulator [Myxococcota bacterium]
MDSPKGHLPCETVTTILESISDGVFTVDQNFFITSFNRAAETITGIPRDKAIGRRCHEVLRPSFCSSGCALDRTVREGRPLLNQSGYFLMARGNRIPVSISTALLKDRDGTVQGMVETFSDLSREEELRRELQGTIKVGRIITRSPLLRRILDVLPQIGMSKSPVLIEGDTGTGKELLAREIHLLSERRGKPFVALNCGALPDTLLESELFGYKAGAFTGALRDKPGLFATAHQGTLFLDEIGEVSPAFQVKLLRVLQEGRYTRLGDVKEQETDVRLVAATNKRLATEVERGNFREDLYYRINVVPLVIPPLSRRPEDIPLLVNHFVERFSRILGRQIQGVDPSALALLLTHPWKGNIRELENAVERAFVLSTGNTLLPEHFPGIVGSRLPEGDLKESPGDFDAQMDTAARRVIQHAISMAGSRQGAAKLLNLHRTTLYRKMKDLGLGS